MLIILVPYRATDQPERAEQLKRFVGCMKQKLPAAYVAVLEQADDRPFNRGALLNAGIECMGAGGDAILCLHDVDLLPQDDILDEYCAPLPESTVRHIGRAWKRYDSDSYMGGILLIRARDFQRVNGFPNDFWGWGGEDDELRDRIQRAGLAVERSEGTIVDQEGLTLQQKLARLRKSGQKCRDKWERRAWHTTHPGADGVRQLAYQIVDVQHVHRHLYHFKLML